MCRDFFLFKFLSSFFPLSVDLTVFCFINCNQHFKSNICNLNSKSSKREIWQEQKQVWFSIHNPTGVQPDGWLSLYRIWAGSSETPNQEKCLCLSISQKLYLKKRRDPKSKLNKRVGNHQCDPPPTHPSHQHFPMQRELLPRDYITHFYSKETLENVCVRVRV